MNSRVRSDNSNPWSKVAKIAVGVDDAFVFPLITLGFSSLPFGLEKEWHLFYFPEKLSVKSRELVQECFVQFGLEIVLHEAIEEPIFDSRRHLTSSTFLKFTAFELLGPGTIWLDSDLLLLAHWTEFEDWLDVEKPIQAIADDKTGHPQFNAGVMVLNQKLAPDWRKRIESAPKNRSSSDQVIFNEIYLPSYGKLPRRFNLLWGRLVTDKVQIRPAIIHFGGPNKPWHLNPVFHQLCIIDDCVWKPYLMIQQAMLGSVSDELREKIEEVAFRTRRTPLNYVKKESLGRHFTYLTSYWRNLSTPLVKLMRVISFLFPDQALHPVHARKHVWDWPSRGFSNEKE